MPDFSMSISQYTYEHLVGLHEDGDYEGLFHWLAGIEPGKGTPKWWGKEWLKYNPAEGHDRDFTEILKEALSDVTFWFLGEDTEYLRKKFWVQAFGKAGDVVPLGKIINRKVHEIFRSAYVAGGMHEKEGDRLARMCREQMQEDQDNFKREPFNGRDYYGLSQWPEIKNKSTLSGGLVDLGKRDYYQESEKKNKYYRYCRVPVKGVRTSPFRKKDVREACLKALEIINKYCLVEQLSKGLEENLWFEVKRHQEKTIEDNHEIPSDNPELDFDFEEPKDKKDKVRKFISSMPRDYLIVLSEKIVPEILDEEESALKILGEKKRALTFPQLSETWGQSHQTWKNRQTEALKAVKTFLNKEKDDALHTQLLKIFINIFENEDLGTLLPINETNESEKQSP